MDMTPITGGTRQVLTEDEMCKRAFVLALKDALNVVSGKWKLALVCALLSGPKGFAQIERLLPEISPRMLTRELRELEANGVIERHFQSDARGHCYRLTPSGEKMQDIIIMMATWGQEHREWARVNL